MKKECSAEETRVKAEAYCSASERCKTEVVQKMKSWGTPCSAMEEILAYLEKERFIDERRYARAYVRDKYRFSQWGRIKIAQSLRMKCLSEQNIEKGMAEIDEKEYLSILTALLIKKMRTVKARNSYELNGKLIRFAAGHGYEMDEILSCLKQMGGDDEFMD